MPTNIEAMQKRSQEIQSTRSYTKTKWYKWKEGFNVLRIVPGFDPRHCDPKPDMSSPVPENARDSFVIEVKKASRVGPKNRTVYLDPRTPGPLEEYIDSLHAVGDEASKKEASDIRPKDRIILFVVDRDCENEGPKALDWNLDQYQRLTEICADPEYGDIANPFTGTDLIIKYVPQSKSGNGFAQWTSILPRRSPSPLTEDGIYWHEWLGTDLFLETRVGEPTDPGYIRACLEGREADYNKQKNSSAVAAEGSLVCEHPFPGTAMFWAIHEGQTIPMSADDIVKHVCAGQDPQIMPHDQSTGWAAASQCGFSLTRPATPPSPALPSPTATLVPTSPSPPTHSGTPAPTYAAPSEVPSQVVPHAVPPSSIAPEAPSATTPVAMPHQPPAQTVPFAPPGPTAPPVPQVPAHPPSPAGGGDEIPFSVPQSETAALEQQLADAATKGSESVVGQDLRAVLGG